MAINSTMLMSMKFLLSFLLIFAVVAQPPTKATAITCDTVTDNIKPCLNYVLSGGNVTKECCSSCKSCIGKTTTTLDRQTLCSCVNDLLSTATKKQVNRFARILEKCGTKFPFKISKVVDCSKVY
nr:nonspecific lipid transfer protein 3 [Solanum melongena]WJJ08747.1 nsLTP3 [Solanum melongena]